MYGGSGGKAIAIYKNGTRKWEENMGSWVISSAADVDDTIYMGSEDGFMYAWNPDGTLKWKETSSYGSVYSNAEVAPNGNLYFCTFTGSSNGYFMAMDKTGKTLWHIGPGQECKSSALADTHAVYMGSIQDKKLHALNLTTGATIWETTLCGGVESSPAMSKDGTPLHVNIHAYDHVNIHA